MCKPKMEALIISYLEKAMHMEGLKMPPDVQALKMPLEYQIVTNRLAQGSGGG